MRSAPRHHSADDTALNLAMESEDDGIISHIIGVGNQMGYGAQPIEVSGCTCGWIRETCKKISNCTVKSWSLSDVQAKYIGFDISGSLSLNSNIHIASYSALLNEDVKGA